MLHLHKIRHSQIYKLWSLAEAVQNVDWKAINRSHPIYQLWDSSQFSRHIHVGGLKTAYLIFIGKRDGKN